MISPQLAHAYMPGLGQCAGLYYTMLHVIANVQSLLLLLTVVYVDKLVLLVHMVMVLQSTVAVIVIWCFVIYVWKDQARTCPLTSLFY